MICKRRLRGQGRPKEELLAEDVAAMRELPARSLRGQPGGGDPGEQPVAGAL